MNLNFFPYRTANEAHLEMQLSALVSSNATDIAGVGNGEWALIAPFGNHPSPDGSYVQSFSRDQAEKVVRSWNSITGTAARCFKNLLHGFGSRFTCPIWEGHPESDKKRWPKEKLLGEISELRVGETGIEGRVTWNAKGMRDRVRGKLFPSALWWHWPPAGVPPTVYPELLESVGLCHEPNIKNVPAWTSNTLVSEEESQSADGVTDRAKLIALLGLAADSTDEQIDQALQGIGSTAEALQSANAARIDLENRLGTANAALNDAATQVALLTGERDLLKIKNAALATANESLVLGVLNLAEKCGSITPAERPAFKTRIATANTAAAALHDLQTREPAITRFDLSTQNSRAFALEVTVTKKMKEENLTWTEAFTKCQADPNLAPLFGAMKDPTRSVKR